MLTTWAMHVHFEASCGATPRHGHVHNEVTQPEWVYEKKGVPMDSRQGASATSRMHRHAELLSSWPQLLIRGHRHTSQTVRQAWSEVASPSTNPDECE